MARDSQKTNVSVKRLIILPVVMIRQLDARHDTVQKGQGTLDTVDLAHSLVQRLFQERVDVHKSRVCRLFLFSSAPLLDVLLGGTRRQRRRRVGNRGNDSDLVLHSLLLFHRRKRDVLAAVLVATLVAILVAILVATLVAILVATATDDLVGFKDKHDDDKEDRDDERADQQDVHPGFGG